MSRVSISSVQSLSQGIPVDKAFEMLADMDKSELPQAARDQIAQELPIWLKANPQLFKMRFKGFNLFHILAKLGITKAVTFLSNSQFGISATNVFDAINELSENKTKEEKYEKVDEHLSPLMMALIHENYETAFELINCGADLWQKNRFERSALFFAKDQNLRNDLRKVAYNAAPEKRGFFASQPKKFPKKLTLQDLDELYEVVRSDRNIFKAATKKSNGIVNSDFFFRIMDLAEYNRDAEEKIIKVIEAILSVKSDFPSLIGTKEMSNNLYHYAADYNIAPLITVIRYEEGKAYKLNKINDLNGEGFTPLIIAAQNQNPQLVEALLAHGADVNVRGKDDKTALDVAKENEKQEIIDLLSKSPDPSTSQAKTKNGIVYRTTSL